VLRSLLYAVLRFRLLLLGAAAVVIAVGVLTVPKMHADALPELGSGPMLEVQTEALGLSSQEVEQYVTVPLENNLLDGIMSVWDVRSHSVPGLSTVDLYFQPGTSVLNARQLVEERLTNAFSLPNVSKPPLLIQPLSSTSRVMMIGLRSSSLDSLELSYLARWVIKPRLSGVPGVANVAIFGQQDRQIQVLVDPAALAANHVALSQIIETAGNAQLVSPLSYLQGSAPGTGGFLDGANQRLEIRPVLPLGAPKNLATVPLSGGPAGRPLGSVSNVVQGHQPLIGDAVVGGGPGLILAVQKLPSASALAVTKGIERELGALRGALSGVTVDQSFFRPAGYVADSLDNLRLALMIAAALALVALGALLLDARSVLIASVSVAFSLLVAVLALKALGYTVNALVILGMLIASGVVVDDAGSASHEIVRRVRERGGGTAAEPISSLVIDASARLLSTLGYCTLIALLLIAPAFFSSGLTARFVHPLVLSFALAVIASAIVALTVTPALAVVLLEWARPRPRATGAARRIRAGYEGLVQRVVSAPAPILVLICTTGLAGGIAFPFLGQPAPPQFKDRNLVVQWDGPAGASLNEMDRVTRRVVGELRKLPAVSDVAATLGRAVSADRIVGTGSGQIFVTLRPGADYDRGLNQVRAIAQATPGIRASVGTYESEVTSRVLSTPARLVTVRVYGQDFNKLGQIAHQIAGAIAPIHGLGAPQLQLQPREPNIEVTVNDAAALQAGVLPGDARRQASTLVSGLTVGNFFVDQAVFDVVVQATPAVRGSLDAVRGLLIDTSGSGHVRLGQIAHVSIRADPTDIQHQALSRYVDVTATVRSGSVAAAQAAVHASLRGVSFPLQYHAEVLGGTPDDATSHTAFLSYALAAAIGVLLLLQAAFRSWRLAAMLFLVLPVALLGGVLVALASGQMGSLGADAALVGLFAFAARQGILQIGHVRRLQAADRESLTPELVVRASVERLMPAVVGVVVTAAAMVPFVVIGDVPGNELTHTAAAVMLGGLASTLLLNQLLLPALYLVFGPREPPPIPEPMDIVPDVPLQAPTTAT
jgi:multidrug efflux pump subunit AcrB